MTKTLVERLVSGETLEAEDALEILNTIAGDSWALWIKVAIVYMGREQYSQAVWILEELISKKENKI